jgi:hypothetical protein
VLKDAADRGRLAASTFKQLHLGMAVLAVLQLWALYQVRSKQQGETALPCCPPFPPSSSPCPPPLSSSTCPALSGCPLPRLALVCLPGQCWWRLTIFCCSWLKLLHSPISISRSVCDVAAGVFCVICPADVCGGSSFELQAVEDVGGHRAASAAGL